MTATPIALTIAGSDSSGGAGIQADLKTFSALGVYGASVITALTAQNTRGVTGVLSVPSAFITAQLDAVMSDLAVSAIKTGMLGTSETVETVVAGLRRHPGIPIVVDPVMVATSGDVLLAADAIEAVRAKLIPLAEVITPNLPESARLLDSEPATDERGMIRQGEALLRLGPRAVLIKGGHGEGDTALDLLITGGDLVRLERPRIATRNTHGTGCTLAAAIAALRAAGVPLVQAVTRAKEYVWRALHAGADLDVGHGHGPVDHLYAIRRAEPPA
jgi:hydroxymethylpyrimidine/phosphomethylpyrimidine kinase